MVFPDVDDIRDVSKRIAVEVCEIAEAEGLNRVKLGETVSSTATLITCHSTATLITCHSSTAT
jgi:hypothetical protein